MFVVLSESIRPVKVLLQFESRGIEPKLSNGREIGGLNKNWKY